MVSRPRKVVSGAVTGQNFCGARLEANKGEWARNQRHHETSDRGCACDRLIRGRGRRMDAATLARASCRDHRLPGLLAEPRRARSGSATQPLSTPGRCSSYLPRAAPDHTARTHCGAGGHARTTKDHERSDSSERGFTVAVHPSVRSLGEAVPGPCSNGQPGGGLAEHRAVLEAVCAARRTSKATPPRGGCGLTLVVHVRLSGCD